MALKVVRRSERPPPPPPMPGPDSAAEAVPRPTLSYLPATIHAHAHASSADTPQGHTARHTAPQSSAARPRRPRRAPSLPARPPHHWRRRTAAGTSVGSSLKCEAPTEDSVLPLKEPTRSARAASTGCRPSLTTWGRRRGGGAAALVEVAGGGATHGPLVKGGTNSRGGHRPCLTPRASPPAHRASPSASPRPPPHRLDLPAEALGQLAPQRDLHAAPAVVADGHGALGGLVARLALDGLRRREPKQGARCTAHRPDQPCRHSARGSHGGAWLGRTAAPPALPAPSPGSVTRPLCTAARPPARPQPPRTCHGSTDSTTPTTSTMAPFSAPSRLAMGRNCAGEGGLRGRSGMGGASGGRHGGRGGATGRAGPVRAARAGRGWAGERWGL
jgi:hypothetical protein